MLPFFIWIYINNTLLKNVIKKNTYLVNEMNYNPKKYVLIQARTSSSRLFGKCIFYIKNKEIIHLLYDRIKSKNYKTTILTSNHTTDDYLSNFLKKKRLVFLEVILIT